MRLKLRTGGKLYSCRKLLINVKLHMQEAMNECDAGITANNQKLKYECIPFS